MAIQALSEAARGAHFLFSHFALLPLVNRRHLQVWAKDGPDAARGVHRLHGDRALAIAGADVLIEGEHHVPAGGCVLVYKEASLLDLVLLNRYVYEHANASVEAEVFAKFPWSREAFSKAGIVVFQRGDRSAAERMLNAVTQRVAQGAKLAMGGEGRLSRDGHVGHFKRGGCLVAIRAGVPVVPVALSGSPAMMPVGALRLKPGHGVLPLSPAWLERQAISGRRFILALPGSLSSREGADALAQHVLVPVHEHGLRAHAHLLGFSEEAKGRRVKERAQLVQLLGQVLVFVDHAPFVRGKVHGRGPQKSAREPGHAPSPSSR